MAHDERPPGRLPPKLYFRIGEVASLVGVEPHVLRYWEREFRTIRPTKSAKGQRVYSRRDVESLMRVRELLYQDGFTIAGAKKRLERGGARHTESRLEREAVVETATETAQIEQKSAAIEVVAAARSVTSKKMQTMLGEMRAEVEAFLAELG